MRLFGYISLIAALVPGLSALTITPDSHVPHPPSKCTNAQSRLCWDGKYDINTDYYTSGPRTGKTVRYNFVLSNVTLHPEGVPRHMLAVNGQVPGPTIIANWGDMIEVTVTNKLKDNATSIHWHGVRQLENSKYDGTNGITECPLAPGDTKVYRFLAEQYGTSWYHSHYSAQYGDGTWGTILINGPASAEYDIDLGTIALSTIYNQTAFQEGVAAEQVGPLPPSTQNTLINGTNVFLADPSLGKRFQTTFKPGKTHRIRFVNTAVDSFFVVSLDNHNMTVIASDFVPIRPYTTGSISIGIGQRYDVVIEANQPVATYWLRVTQQGNFAGTGGGFCGAVNSADRTENGFIAYQGASGLPKTVGPIPANNTQCTDETQLVPYLPITVDPSGFDLSDASVFNVSQPLNSTDPLGRQVIRWTIAGKTEIGQWDYPTLQQLADRNTTFSPPTLNPVFLNKPDSTAYWIVNNTFPIAHPMHLHGHDFNIIASGAGTFDPSTVKLNWNNPPRRDTAMLPGSGYLILAVKVDNPGTWLFHCHIAWHVSQGLSLQVIERQDEIFDHQTLDPAWEKTCKNFKKW
ncbi:hypothetical protein EXIGLDRAFT_718938 [Exidia glandulosa HHB12029]|uniref:laccase n=1 Tax=Exidia glandulosa HHB12029 TaxID=1314781 RepID=A0A165NSW6_EXIGL|nr:hypothetical protein EXIGLDRAFT_718938 [Exidia glandulosa HHB12029]